jgi:hypothetical protein
MVTRYSDAEREQIYAAAREAIEAADRTLAEPRPELPSWPPCETRSQKWERETREREQQFAAERREQTLTETEAARLEHRLAAQIGTGLGEQKELLLAVLAHSLAGMRDEVIEHLEAKIAALGDELGALRADRTLDRALAKGEPGGGEIIDLPQIPLKRKIVA